jgi:hypothetical protein
MTNFAVIANIFRSSEITPTPREVLIQLFNQCFMRQTAVKRPFWNQKTHIHSLVAIMDSLADIVVTNEISNASDLKIITAINASLPLLSEIQFLANTLERFLECYPYFIMQVDPTVIAILNPQPYGIRSVKAPVFDEQKEEADIKKQLALIMLGENDPSHFSSILSRYSDCEWEILERLIPILNAAEDEDRIVFIYKIIDYMNTYRSSYVTKVQSVLRYCFQLLLDSNKQEVIYKLVVEKKGGSAVFTTLHDIMGDVFASLPAFMKENTIQQILNHLKTDEPSIIIIRRLKYYVPSLSVSSKKQVIDSLSLYLSGDDRHVIFHAVAVIDACLKNDLNIVAYGIACLIPCMETNDIDIFRVVIEIITNYFENLDTPQKNTIIQKLLTLAYDKTNPHRDAALKTLLLLKENIPTTQRFLLLQDVATSFIQNNAEYGHEEVHYATLNLYCGLVKITPSETLHTETIREVIKKINANLKKFDVLFLLSSLFDEIPIPEGVRKELFIMLDNWFDKWESQEAASDILGKWVSLNPNRLSKLLLAQHGTESVVVTQELSKILLTANDNTRGKVFQNTMLLLKSGPAVARQAAYNLLRKYDVPINENLKTFIITELLEKLLTKQTTPSIKIETIKNIGFFAAIVPPLLRTEVVNSILPYISPDAALSDATFTALHILAELYPFIEVNLKSKIIEGLLIQALSQNIENENYVEKALLLLCELITKDSIEAQRSLMEDLSAPFTDLIARIEAENALEEIKVTNNKYDRLIQVISILIAEIPNILNLAAASFKIIIEQVRYPEDFDKLFADASLTTKKQYLPYLVIQYHEKESSHPGLIHALQAAREDYDKTKAIIDSTGINVGQVISVIRQSMG